MDDNFNYIASVASPDEYYTEYLEEVMEVEAVADTKIVSDSNSFRATMLKDLFCVKFIPSLRQFKGQTSAPKSAEFTISSSSVNGFHEKILGMVKSQIKGSISSSETGYEFEPYTDKEVTTDDLPNFILFYDEVQKRNYNPTSITTKTLHGWKDKTVHLYIHIYGLVVASKAIYLTVKEQLLDPIEKDKAGAASNNIIFDLLERLKEIHRHTYRTKDLNWYEWASYIATEPPQRHEQMLNEPPPREMIRLFERAPFGSDHVLTEVRRNVNIAQTINAGQERDLQQMGRTISQLKELFDECHKALTDLQLKYDAIMETTNNNNSILESVQQSTRPVETERALNLYYSVHNQEDVDHHNTSPPFNKFKTKFFGDITVRL